MTTLSPQSRARLESSIMGHEGLMLRVYDDATGRVVQPGQLVKGWLSIGYGRNLVGRGITRAEADYLLDNDIEATDLELSGALPEWLSWAEPRRLAVFELAFNMGAERFVRGWPNMVADMKAGRWSDAGAKLAASRWRQQVGDSRALPIIRAIVTGGWS